MIINNQYGHIIIPSIFVFLLLINCAKSQYPVSTFNDRYQYRVLAQGASEFPHSIGANNNSTYLCFFMSTIPFLPYPNLSDGLSRHSLLMSMWALRLIFFGNSITSMPLRIILYVFMGSEPENGGLKNMEI